MNKKLIVVRNESGVPIAIEEIKEFTNAKELDAFIQEVKENSDRHNELLENRKKEQEEKENALNERLNAIESKLDKLTQYIYSILGVESEDEISEVLTDGND